MQTVLLQMCIDTFQRRSVRRLFHRYMMGRMHVYGLPNGEVGRGVGVDKTPIGVFIVLARKPGAGSGSEVL